MRPALLGIALVLSAVAQAYAQNDVRQIEYEVNYRATSTGVAKPVSFNCRRINTIRFSGGNAYLAVRSSRCADAGSNELPADQGRVYNTNGQVISENYTCQVVSKSTQRCSNGDQFKGDYSSVVGGAFAKNSTARRSSGKLTASAFSMSETVSHTYSEGTTVNESRKLVVSISGNNCRVTQHQDNWTNSGGIGMRTRLLSQKCRIVR